MLIALISDIHGNEIALRVVLHAIEERGVDQVVCLGDVATLGPHPRTVIKALRELGCPCILGNHDEFLLDAERIEQYTTAPEIIKAVDWCRDQLTEEDLAFIRSFESHVELPLGGGSSALIVHGSPRSTTEDILATTPPDEVDIMLAGQSAALVASGHTHIQMLRQHRRTLIVNPGSVGLPFEEYVGGRVPTILAHAEYATIDADDKAFSVTLHRITLDKRALRESLKPSELPTRDFLLHQYS